MDLTGDVQRLAPERAHDDDFVRRANGGICGRGGKPEVMLKALSSICKYCVMQLGAINAGRVCSRWDNDIIIIVIASIRCYLMLEKRDSYMVTTMYFNFLIAPFRINTNIKYLFCLRFVFNNIVNFQQWHINQHGFGQGAAAINKATRALPAQDRAGKSCCKSSTNDNALTLDPQCQLIADRFALAVDCAARVISGRVTVHLLQHQALVRADHPGGSVVSYHQALEGVVREERKKIIMVKNKTKIWLHSVVGKM